MTGTNKNLLLWTLLVLVFGAGIASWLFRAKPLRRLGPIVLKGVVLTQENDSKSALPIADTRVIAARGDATDQARSDAAGLYQVSLPAPLGRRSDETTLTFTHPGFQPLEITVDDTNKLFIAHLTPIAQLQPAKSTEPQVPIKNLRVRYSEKASYMSNTGTLVKELEVPNVANVPCNNQSPCSPDGRWKASLRSFPIDAEGNELRNIRLSCIAGPCPFSRVESQMLTPDARKLNISILNWSDTTTYLLEAEVSRTIVSDMVRQSFPALFGRSMSFTLPASAVGPSIEAEVNGAEIVYPLGPLLKLSWAVCSEKNIENKAKLFRCDLKDGYRFQ